MLDTTTEAIDFTVKASQEMDQWDEIPMLMVVHESGEHTLAALDGDIFEMLARVGPKLKRPGITGLVLTNEGWGLSVEAVGSEAGLRAVQAELALTGRRFSDHPAAVEIKLFTAIDREGITAREIQRGKPEVIHREDATMGGRLVDYLKALFKEVTA